MKKRLNEERRSSPHIACVSQGARSLYLCGIKTFIQYVIMNDLVSFFHLNKLIKAIKTLRMTTILPQKRNRGRLLYNKKVFFQFLYFLLFYTYLILLKLPKRIV